MKTRECAGYPSNGSALTASDVKYSFERLLIAAAQNTDIPLEVVDAEALMNKEADSLEGFEVTDDTHFSITLKAPNAGFLAELSAPAMSVVDAETMAQVKNFGREPADKIVTAPRVGLTYLIMNEENEYLRDVNVRKAIGMAINVDDIITNLYSGNAIRENGIIPTGIWGHNDSLTGFPYDPEGAQQLLSDAGYTKGQIYFELSMDSSANSDTQLLYQNISQELGKIGINAEVKTYDHSSWLALRNSGKMNSFVARWGMDYNDPSNIMYSFFGSEENTRNRSINYPDKETNKRMAACHHPLPNM